MKGSHILENLEKTKSKDMVDLSPRGPLIIAACKSARYLARTIVTQIGSIDEQMSYLEDLDFRFSDSEIGVRLDTDVSGSDVFLLQALYNPTSDVEVSENYLALCIAARTFREWGAHKVTAVVPYLAYARQDKPTRFQREPTTARLMADLAITSGIDRLVTWHPHYQQIHGFYGGIPVDVLEALDFFIELFGVYHSREDVILVAPDIGVSKFVTHLGRALDLKVAIASKFHPAQEETEISQIIGDLASKRIAVVIDDMMSSGETLARVVTRLVEDHEIKEIVLGVSHNLCTQQAYERMQNLHQHYNLLQLHVTNSIPQTEIFRQLPFLTVHDLSDALAQTINRIHRDRF